MRGASVHPVSGRTRKETKAQRGREGGREGWREGAREPGNEGAREPGSEGARERGSQGVKQRGQRQEEGNAAVHQVLRAAREVVGLLEADVADAAWPTQRLSEVHKQGHMTTGQSVET